MNRQEPGAQRFAGDLHIIVGCACLVQVWAVRAQGASLLDTGRALQTCDGWHGVTYLTGTSIHGGLGAGGNFSGDLVPVVASLEGPGLPCGNQWPQHPQLKRRLPTALPRPGQVTGSAPHSCSGLTRLCLHLGFLRSLHRLCAGS